MDLKTLEEQRDKEITGFFWLGLKIALIFGVPAFSVIFISKKITGEYKSTTTTIGLIISFVLSWMIIILIYRKKSKKLKLIEDQIKEIKNGKIN